MKLRAILAVLVAAVAASVSHAQAVTIKLKERGDGEIATVKEKKSASSIVTVTDGKGNVLVDKKERADDVQEYTETILKREKGKTPTAVERAYGKVQVGKGGPLDDSPLKDKTVIIEKKAGKYTFTYKGGKEVTGQAAAALAKDFGKKSDSNAELERLVLPNKAVKPGESWKIEMAKIVSELAKQGAMELDDAKSTGTGTLVKTYQKNGAQFGELKFKLVMPIMTIGKGNDQLKFTDGAKIDIDMTFDVCIDGSSETGTLKMKMVMGGNATIPAAPGAMATLNVTVDATQVQEELKK